MSDAKDILLRVNSIEVIYNHVILALTCFPFSVLEAIVVVAEDFAVAVALRTRGCEAEMRDMGAALGGAGLGRGADIAGEDDEILHGWSSFVSGPRDRPFD